MVWGGIVYEMYGLGVHQLMFFRVPRETGRLLLPKKHVRLGKIESKGVLGVI